MDALIRGAALTVVILTVLGLASLAGLQGPATADAASPPTTMQEQVIAACGSAPAKAQMK